MKKYILSILVLAGCVVACENKEETKTSDTDSKSSVTLPYQASYTTDFTNNVSDSDLLVVLNSYKHWETGDMSALRSTFADTATFLFSGGMKFTGAADSMIKEASVYRDSLSAVKIEVITWLKNHSAKDSADWINVWYKEIDTYKTGRVDSAEYVDDNLIKNGKIVYSSSHKQVLK